MKAMRLRLERLQLDADVTIGDCAHALAGQTVDLGIWEAQP